MIRRPPNAPIQTAVTSLDMNTPKAPSPWRIDGGAALLAIGVGSCVAAALLLAVGIGKVASTYKENGVAVGSLREAKQHEAMYEDWHKRDEDIKAAHLEDIRDVISRIDENRKMIAANNQTIEEIRHEVTSMGAITADLLLKLHGAKDSRVLKKMREVYAQSQEAQAAAHRVLGVSGAGSVFETKLKRGDLP